MERGKFETLAIQPSKIQLENSQRPGGTIDRALLEHTTYQIKFPQNLEFDEMNDMQSSFNTLDSLIIDGFASHIGLPSSSIKIDNLKDCALFIAYAQKLNIPLPHESAKIEDETEIRANMHTILSHESITKTIKNTPQYLYECVNVDLIMVGNPIALRQTALLIMNAINEINIPLGIVVSLVTLIDGVEDHERVYKLTPTRDEITIGVLQQNFNHEISNEEEFKKKMKRKILDFVDYYNIDFFKTRQADVPLYELCKDARVLIEILGHAKHCFIRGYRRDPGTKPDEEINYYWSVITTLCSKVKPKEAIEYNLNALKSELTEVSVYKMIYFFLFVIDGIIEGNKMMNNNN